jgi:hypothetical protein
MNKGEPINPREWDGFEGGAKGDCDAETCKDVRGWGAIPCGTEGE